MAADAHSTPKDFGVTAAELPALSDSSELAGQHLSMCLDGTPQSPLNSPADLASVVSAVTGVKATKVAFVSMARPSGAGYSVLDSDDVANPHFLHRDGCPDRPLVFLDGGRISYLRPQRTASDDNSLDYLSTEGGSGPLMIVVHTSGSFLVPEFAVTGELAVGSAITITATNSQLDSGWDFSWACASAGQVQNRTTRAVTCTWASTGNFGVTLTAQAEDGSMAYGTTSVRIGPAAPSPTPGASGSATTGSSTGASDSGGKGTGSPTATSTAGSGSHQHATATASASATASPTGRPTTATPTPTPSPQPSATHAPDELTGYLLTMEEASGPAAESGADQVRAGGGVLFHVPLWAWGVAAGVAALVAGMIGESWWLLLGTRASRTRRHRVEGAE